MHRWYHVCQQLERIHICCYRMDGKIILRLRIINFSLGYIVILRHAVGFDPSPSVCAIHAWLLWSIYKCI